MEQFFSFASQIKLMIVTHKNTFFKLLPIYCSWTLLCCCYAPIYVCFSAMSAVNKQNAKSFIRDASSNPIPSRMIG